MFLRALIIFMISFSSLNLFASESHSLLNKVRLLITNNDDNSAAENIPDLIKLLNNNEEKKNIITSLLVSAFRFELSRTILELLKYPEFLELSTILDNRSRMTILDLLAMSGEEAIISELCAFRQINLNQRTEAYGWVLALESKLQEVESLTNLGYGNFLFFIEHIRNSLGDRAYSHNLRMIIANLDPDRSSSSDSSNTQEADDAASHEVNIMGDDAQSSWEEISIIQRHIEKSKKTNDDIYFMTTNTGPTIQIFLEDNEGGLHSRAEADLNLDANNAESKDSEYHDNLLRSEAIRKFERAMKETQTQIIIEFIEEEDSTSSSSSSLSFGLSGFFHKPFFRRFFK